MHLKIDDVDLKILSELLKDGRKSFAEIAKECNTSKGVIARRFKQMEDAGIIVGSTIQNSIACYNKKMIAVIYIFIENGKTEQVLDFLATFTQITQVFPSKVEPFILIWAVLGDTEEFESFRQQLINGRYIKTLDSQFFLGIRNHPENLSIFGNKPKLNEHKKSTHKIKIDEIDVRLIEKLAANGRITFSQLAKDIGTTTETVSRRYERLKSNGLIRVVLRIDPRKIGYVAFATFRVKYTKSDLNILNDLSEIPDITQIQRTSGQYDYRMIVMLRDLEHLLDIQSRVRKVAGVAAMVSNIMPLFSPWPTFREFLSTE
jgi:DNA-binding Lrp family transcriptional regulator